MPAATNGSVRKTSSLLDAGPASTKIAGRKPHLSQNESRKRSREG